jgi:hypothetical protein
MESDDIHDQAQPLIIAGMPRSGTTLLQRLSDHHPQMRVSNDFGNYAFIGDSFPVYMAKAARRVLEINGRSRINGAFGGRRTNYVSNIRTTSVHLLRLAQQGNGPVSLTALAVEAGKNDPRTRIVGDKFPQYIFKMNRFVELPDLLRLVIYRDCRDVTSSFLRMVRTAWKYRRWIRDTNTVETIARRWVQAIEIMERHAGYLFVIRYEDLVGDPRLQLQRLAECLNVEPSGFNARMVSESSVGKYKRGLTAEEQDAVLAVAGSTLERLKYTLS